MDHQDAGYYIQQLNAHSQLHNSKTLTKPKHEPTSIRNLLEGLKEHLSNKKFLEDFISDENNGVEVIGKFLSDTQAELKKYADGATINGGSETLDRRQSRATVYAPRTLKDEVDTINCLRKMTETEKGLKVIVHTANLLENVAQAIISKSLSSRLYTFVILIRACDIPGGNKRILDVMTHVKVQIKERVRFHAITQMVLRESSRTELVALCLRFLNTILVTVNDLNKRVYLQYELELADFDPIKAERNYGDNVPHTIKQELDFWHSHYISIERLQENLSVFKNRNDLLRQEVDRQTEKLWKLEHEKSSLKGKLHEANDNSEGFRNRVVELQEAMEKMSQVYKQKTGIKPEQQFTTLNYIMRPVEEIPDNNSDTSSIASSFLSDDTASSIPPVPPSAPVPPPAPPSDNRKKSSILPGAPLPMLNWIPIHSAGHTVFKELDDERIFSELDFTDFEETFRLRDYRSSNKIQERINRLKAKQSKTLSLIDTNRAKNLVITLRNIALPVKNLIECVDFCDTSSMSPDAPELLLQFIPTKDDLKVLAENAEQYKSFGEAEQYMFQLVKVDRYESKLRLMAFMNIYEDLVSSIKPFIVALTIASKSVTNSKKLKRIFELILAFGNYMNSTRRGAAYGFRLDSLDRLSFVKSTDRRISFVNYLVETIKKCYPDLHDWYSELKITDISKCSLEALTIDIQGLRKGLELVKAEREHQRDSVIIAEFSRKATDTISELSNQFRKMEELYRQACSLYAENYKIVEPYEFFAKFVKFHKDYQKAEKETKEKNIQLKPQTLSARPKNGAVFPQRLEQNGIAHFGRKDSDPSNLLKGSIRTGQDDLMVSSPKSQSSSKSFSPGKTQNLPSQNSSTSAKKPVANGGVKLLNQKSLVNGHRR